MTAPISAKYRDLGLALLFCFALVFSLISGDSLRYLDEGDYDQLARSLVHRHTFAFADGVPTAFRPPAYPAVIAAAYVFAERPLAAKIENAVLLVLAALALSVAAKRIYAKAGSITPYLVLGYPLLIYAASVLYPQILGCLLLTTAVVLISGEKLSWKSAAIAGFSYGILILAIPYFLLTLPVLAGYILIRRDLHRVIRVRSFILFACAAGLVVTPWTLRNYLEFHSLIPISPTGGLNLFLGNSPVTTPNGGVGTIDANSLCKRVRADMSVIERDRAIGQCALDWIAENPRAAGELYARKVINYFNFRNEIATKNAASAWTDWILFATYYPLLFAAILRAALFRRFPFDKTEALIYVLYFANAFISAIYFTRIRFRIPFDFLLVAVVAAFLCRVWDLCLRRRASPVNS